MTEPTAPGQLLFVYGTLRHGGSNDMSRFLPVAVKVGNARMRGHLFDLGSYPALVADAAGGWVNGELYAIPEASWVALDALEEIVTLNRPAGEYYRISGSAQVIGGDAVACQVYVANPAVMTLDRPIASGDWIAFAATRGDETSRRIA